MCSDPANVFVVKIKEQIFGSFSQTLFCLQTGLGYNVLRVQVASKHVQSCRHDAGSLSQDKQIVCVNQGLGPISVAFIVSRLLFYELNVVVVSKKRASYSPEEVREVSL